MQSATNKLLLRLQLCARSLALIILNTLADFVSILFFLLQSASQLGCSKGTATACTNGGGGGL
jgi:hypothetical protein